MSRRPIAFLIFLGFLAVVGMGRVPRLQVNLAVIAAGLVFVPKGEADVPHGYVATKPTGMS